MHTPAPWYISQLCQDDHGNDYYTIGTFPIGPGTEHPNADTHVEDTICEVWGGNHDGLANAQTIAKAPVLAERVSALEDALRNLLADCETLYAMKDCRRSPRMERATELLAVHQT